MDKTIPQAAASIITFIYRHESRGDYEAISSFKQRLLPKKITSMSVDEVLKEQQTWRKKYGTLSSAAGAPQIIYKTLLRLKEVMGLSGKEKFDANLQDRMAFQLLRYRGYDAFMAGQMSVVEFGKAVAQEWASMPVLAGTKNYKGVNIKRGSSYYAGDGLNASGTGADEFERVLKARSVADKHISEMVKAPADGLEHVLNDAQENLTASANVKPADGPVATATKVGAAVATGAAVVGGAGEAAKTVTDWQPIIELTSSIAKYGPAVAGAIVVAIVIVVIARKVWQ